MTKEEAFEDFWNAGEYRQIDREAFKQVFFAGFRAACGEHYHKMMVPMSPPIRVENSYVILEEWMVKEGLVKEYGDQFWCSIGGYGNWMYFGNFDTAYTSSDFKEDVRRPISIWNSSEIGKKFPVEVGL